GAEGGGPRTAPGGLGPRTPRVAAPLPTAEGWRRARRPRTRRAARPGTRRAARPGTRRAARPGTRRVLRPRDAWPWTTSASGPEFVAGGLVSRVGVHTEPGSIVRSPPIRSPSGRWGGRAPRTTPGRGVR